MTTCAAPGCDNEGVDRVDLGVMLPSGSGWMVGASFVMCAEHDLMTAVIVDEVSTLSLPSFRATVYEVVRP